MGELAEFIKSVCVISGYMSLMTINDLELEQIHALFVELFADYSEFVNFWALLKDWMEEIHDSN